ncbi:MAG: retroviral-like aspartic protease family protein [Chloroflexota bacterium]
MTNFSYDDAYTPPAPSCTVTLIAPSSKQRFTVNVFIDTGADASIIPLHYLQEIGARRVSETGLRSQWGERRRVFLYLVDMQIADVTLNGLYVVADEIGDECILGRDALNQLRLLLDGPAAVAQLLT